MPAKRKTAEAAPSTRTSRRHAGEPVEAPATPESTAKSPKKPRRVSFARADAGDDVGAGPSGGIDVPEEPVMPELDNAQHEDDVQEEAEEAEITKKAVENEERNKAEAANEAEEAAKKAADDEAAKKAADDEAAKKAADDEAAKKAADDEAAKKAADDEAAKKPAKEVDSEVEEIPNKASSFEKAGKKATDEADRKAADEAARKAADDEGNDSDVVIVEMSNLFDEEMSKCVAALNPAKKAIWDNDSVIRIHQGINQDAVDNIIADVKVGDRVIAMHKKDSFVGDNKFRVIDCMKVIHQDDKLCVGIMRCDAAKVDFEKAIKFVQTVKDWGKEYNTAFGQTKPNTPSKGGSKGGSKGAASSESKGTRKKRGSNKDRVQKPRKSVTDVRSALQMAKEGPVSTFVDPMEIATFINGPVTDELVKNVCGQKTASMGSVKTLFTKLTKIFNEFIGEDIKELSEDVQHIIRNPDKELTTKKELHSYTIGYKEDGVTLNEATDGKLAIYEQRMKRSDVALAKDTAKNVLKSAMTRASNEKGPDEARVSMNAILGQQTTRCEVVQWLTVCIDQGLKTQVISRFEVYDNGSQRYFPPKDFEKYFKLPQLRKTTGGARSKSASSMKAAKKASLEGTDQGDAPGSSKGQARVDRDDDADAGGDADSDGESSDSDDSEGELSCGQ
jgi:hypothetical protein